MRPTGMNKATALASCRRKTQSRTVFRTVFAPSPNPNPDVFVVASSDGSLAPYSISSCITSSQPMRFNNSRLLANDGRIRGWKWEEVLNSDLPLSIQGNHLNPVFDLVNPQHKLQKGKCVQVINPKDKSKLKESSSWVSCIAVDTSESWLACGSGRNFSVWSLPACECILTINMHSLTQDVLFDENKILAVGAEPVLTRFDINGMVLSQIQCAPQSSFSLSQHPSGVIAVGGYGLIDVISEFGSHLCTFRCKGL